jgi:hypothetical protein
MLPDSAKLTAEFQPNLLKGVTVIKGKAVALSYDAHGTVQKRDETFTAIPYYAWANRGRGQMMVWIPNSEASARPAPYPTLATTAKVSVSSNPHRMNANNINDGETPAASNDRGSYFDWWNRRGNTEWVEYAFAQPAAVSQSEVYWFDDTGSGGVRVPASWRILYRDGDTWKPVEPAVTYGVERNQFNRVTFRAVTTTALRLELTAQEQFSAGIQEWKAQ